MRRGTSRRLWGVILLLCLGAATILQLRSSFILRFFGAGTALEPSLSQEVSTDASLNAHPRVRVLLIDGLGAMQADRMPTLMSICHQGLTLEVDNGFPTVSLPVQHVLWTGLTQQQSGILYRLEELEDAPSLAIPLGVEGSVAVAESHGAIINSFGFSQTLPASASASITRTGTGRLVTPEFMTAAREAVRSPSRLAFIHFLRVDEDGHTFGRESLEYRSAAVAVDGLLAELVQADPASRWFVLSDHGHRARGGHGGAEPEIRKVRACIAGQVPPSLRRAHGRLTLVDYSRAIRDSLGQQSPQESLGRPLREALARTEAQRGDTTLVSVVWWRGLWAAVALVLGFTLALCCARVDHGGWGTAWLIAAYCGVLFFAGAVTLSNSAVYPPLGRDLMCAAGPGWLVFSWHAWTRHHAIAIAPWHYVGAMVAPCMSMWIASMVLCGGDLALLRGDPPLIPVWTAHASLFAVMSAGGCAMAAVAIVFSLWRGRTRSR